MKILILRFSSIGDIVLTTPVIRNLKEGLRDSEIHFATKEQFVPIVASNPFIDQIITLKESLGETIGRLKKEKYDLIIDLHKNIRTLRIKQALGVKSNSFKKLNALKWLSVNTKWDVLPDVHVVDRYLETIKPLKIELDGGGLDYFIPEEERISISDIDPQLESSFYSFVIGGQHKTKILPPKKVVEAISFLKKPVVLLGGEEDIQASKEILKMAPENKKVFNAVGKFSINQSASIIEQSSGVLSNDTGLMHIAAAFKKPIISFWGNTIPEFGMYPYRVDYLAIENKELSCRPCTKLGFEKCPKKHFKCMLGLEFGEYLDEFLSKKTS